MSAIASYNRIEINAEWLVKLRWVAIVGQLITITFVTRLLDVAIEQRPLFLALGVTFLSNVYFTIWLKRRDSIDESAVRKLQGNRVLVTLLLLDLLVLTILLYFTGGHSNPFLLFYFVNLALSGILLPARWAWLLTGLTIANFAALFFYQVPLSELQQPQRLTPVSGVSSITLAQIGLLVAFAVCSSVIVYFATRLTRELQLRDEALLQAEIRQARSDKWEALGTLATGAAHELATPLATIAVVCKEIQRELGELSAGGQVMDDLQVIRQELDRCRGILNQMSTNAGHLTTEQSSTCQVDQLMNESLDTTDRIELRFTRESRIAKVKVPRQTFGMALRSLVQNGLDASPDKPVEVNLSIVADHLCIEVTDHGSGMTKEVLARADEPFYSTKEAGKGMGLGRFLARTILERLGGSVETCSTPDEGTRVMIQLPLESSK